MFAFFLFYLFFNLKFIDFVEAYFISFHFRSQFCWVTKVNNREKKRKGGKKHVK